LKNYKIYKNYNIPLINKINPKIIFFIHWSKIVPKKIVTKFTCIQFHTSDLPKFRGASPIQNQIINGLKKTKISAFKINSGLDIGGICLKKN